MADTHDAPELIPRLRYSKSWEDPADYATRQNSEMQNRKDAQSLFTETQTYINHTMLPRVEQLISGNGGSGTGTATGGGVSGDYLPLDGGTMRGPLRLYRDPVLNAESATKQYVDGAAGNVAANVNGSLTAIRQSVDEIELLAQSHDDEIASLRVQADEISSGVENLGGQVSTVTQRADAIETRVENAEGDISTLSQTVGGITMGVATVTENGQVYSRLTLKIGENNLYGYIRMQGNVDVSGQLSAEALYSGYGEIANLAVDRLITSRRIVKYLAGDASDDNYIRVYQQNVEWVTGAYAGGTAQAVNPDGAPLYWPVNVANLSRGADGYPVNQQGERVFTVTTPTNYPVMVYNYTEAVKRSISFEPVNGVYSPIDRFGAGNRQGNNKAWILKTADGFDIRYLTPDNKEIGIRMGADGKVKIDGLAYDVDAIRAALGMANSGGAGGESVSGGGGNGGGNGGGSGGGGNGGGSGGDGIGKGFDLTQINADGTTSGLTVDASGYADISGLRKVTALDFSGLDGGIFTETLDGGILNAYQVQRDASGRVSSITDASGHETVVAW